MGKSAIVTGGGTGIGAGIAQALTAEGIDCLLVGRRLEPLQQTVESLAGGKGRAHILSADVSDPAGRAAIIAAANERFGKIDILVNNAGGGNSQKLFDYTVEAWREVINVNLEASFFLALAALEGMRARKFGRIVNIGSILGILGNDATSSAQGLEDTPRGPWRGTAYNAAKGGIAAMTRDLAVAAAPWGVTVNTVSPGYIERPGRARAPEVLAKIAARTPMGRHGEPADIGHAVAYLVSDGANYVTGHDLVVDGGRTIW